VTSCEEISGIISELLSHVSLTQIQRLLGMLLASHGLLSIKIPKKQKQENNLKKGRREFATQPEGFRPTSTSSLISN
jgi:hypothetical protein